MSEGFRCDGCDEYHGGNPTQVKVCLEYSTVGRTITLGHCAGRADAHPGEQDAETHEARWPWHSRSVEFCATCTAEYLVPALLDAAMQGRYALGQRYQTPENGPQPWASDPNIPTRQPAFCPYCGSQGAKDGLGSQGENGYRHHCPDCGHEFATFLPPEVEDHA